MDDERDDGETREVVYLEGGPAHATLYPVPVGVGEVAVERRMFDPWRAEGVFVYVRTGRINAVGRTVFAYREDGR